MNTVLERHYRRLASSYNDYLSYSPDFVRHHTRKMIELLQLREDDILADLGCGTGMYSADILQQVPLKHPVIGVDPFVEMLDQVPGDLAIERVVDDALEFSREAPPLSKVLVKETIHHIERRRELFENLYRCLAPGGRMVLVHVPPEIEYPLFRAALKRSHTWHADPDELERLLRTAGFRVERDELCWLHRLPKEHYFEMVEGRYMSLLSSFGDEELHHGLEEMREMHASCEMLEFTDRFIYLTAIKD